MADWLTIANARELTAALAFCLLEDDEVPLFERFQLGAPNTDQVREILNRIFRDKLDLDTEG